MKISERIFKEEDYKSELASLLEKCSLEEKNAYHQFNSSVFAGCRVCYDDIFEMITGAIKIYDWEWQLDKSPLKRLFSKSKKGSWIYAINLDDSIMLRGPQVYYYLVCYKKKNKKIETQQIIEWKNNIRNFISEIIYSVKQVCLVDVNHNSLIQRKFILGILDNLRHLFIICLNANILEKNKDNSYFIEHIDRDEYLKSYYRDLSTCYSLFELILFTKRYNMHDIIEPLLHILNNCAEKVENTFSKIININSIELNNKCFKLHREADSFVENYISVLNVIEKLKQKKTIDNPIEKINLYGILSGAIEFQILFYHSYEKASFNFNYIYINGDYLERHNHNEKKEKYEVAKKKKGIILDDNVMTGSTLEIATKYVQIKDNCQVERYFILRHPELNRIPQMLALKKRVSIDFLNQKCLGLISHSPYSKIKKNTNYCGEYLDELGVFTLTGDFFLRYLFKNGLYDIESEVGNIAFKRQ